MTGVGLKEFSQDIEHIDLDKLIGQFMAFEKNAETLKPQTRVKNGSLSQDIR